MDLVKSKLPNPVDLQEGEGIDWTTYDLVHPICECPKCGKPGCKKELEDVIVFQHSIGMLAGEYKATSCVVEKDESSEGEPYPPLKMFVIRTTNGDHVEERIQRGVSAPDTLEAVLKAVPNALKTFCGTGSSTDMKIEVKELQEGEYTEEWAYTDIRTTVQYNKATEEKPLIVGI